MKTTITGKNMTISAGITERVMKKTSKMERYLHTDTEMIVRFTREKNGRRTCEITVPFEGVILRAEASNDDNLYVCIDQALAKLEKQIHKHRTKLGKRVRDDAFQTAEYEYADEADAGEEEKRKIVRTKSFPMRPMSVEDAVLQMELLGHSFFAFVNGETGQTNVLYLRKDGNLGLLEPEN
ncbi:MAG TPA: ribosome-associated translation inhibitor RaiA [Candidatus Limiplasma sp.]|nr:ribosome-associated translation inhibitor RaiA [Candidatus Limiplasma sp.]HPS81801.1 ribosome-associated translation inhibitor RaiA [Candidatus Limiplasma sp.]